MPPFACDFRDPFGNRIQVVDLKDRGRRMVAEVKSKQSPALAVGGGGAGRPMAGARPGRSTFLLTASGMALDRSGAIHAARAYLASLGVETAGFRAQAAFWADDNLAAYLQARYSPAEARRRVAAGEAVPALWIVWLQPPGSEDSDLRGVPLEAR